MDFLQDELNFLRNIQIFKKNSAKYCVKYISQDLMGSIPVRLGKRERSEPVLKPCFSALSALAALAKSTLGGARQVSKSHKNQRLEDSWKFCGSKYLQMRGEFLQ
jgi:hypothetical protein